MLLSLRKRVGTLTCSVLVAFLFTLPFTPLLAQNRNTGEIRGTVTDSSGAVVSGARVTITNTSTGVRTQVIAGATGVYDGPSLEPGEYSIEFSKEGFGELLRNGITLHVEAITVDATLKVGSFNEKVTITADVPLVQTETSELSTTITAKTITELPNIGRNWYDLTGQLPGVNTGAGSQDASGQGVGVNGTAGFQNNWAIDGGVAMFPVSQNPDLLQVPLEAISEVSLSTSNFNAEYGNGAAVFNVITKSGTNQFHGSAFWFVQNDIFQARNYFATTVLPLRWNEFGGTLGGPIRRDKAFFFFSFQRNPTSTSAPVFYTFPTAAMRSGNFSDPGLPTVYDPASTTCSGGTCTRTAFPGKVIPQNRIDPVAAKIQTYLPLPNRPGLFNNYQFSLSTPITTTWYNVKIDYNISSKNRLMGSVMVVPQNIFTNTPTCPIGCYAQSIRETQGQISEVTTLSAMAVNEFRFSVAREGGKWNSNDSGKGYPQTIGLPSPQSDVFPNITVGGAVPTSIGTGINAKLGFTAFTTSNTLTWVKGKHILKFGGEYNRWQDNLAWQYQNSGNFDFSGLFTRNPSDPSSVGLGYGDFLLGLPGNWAVSIPPESGYRSWNLQAFAQDDYKITPRLTLNFGVRYVLQAGWTEVQNKLGNFDPSLVNPATGTLGATCFAGLTFGGHKCNRALQKTVPDIFDPRVGFAWAPGNNWSVRGGFGIFRLSWGANNYTNGYNPGTISGSLSVTDQITPIFKLSQGPPPGSIINPSAAQLTPDVLNGQGISYTPYNTPAGYVKQWQFSIQHQIWGGVVLDAAYVGSEGVHLYFPRDINQVPAQLLGPGDAQSRRRYPQYSGINASLYDGISNYNSFQLSGKKQFSRGLSLIVNYTFSKSLDTLTSPGWAGTNLIVDPYQNSFNPRANYGLSQSDTPQLLNGSFVYELPFGSGKAMLNSGSLLNGLVGGWQLSGTFQLHSGLPFTPVIGTADLSNSLAGTSYPNRLAKGTLPHPSVNLWFDPTAFAQPAPFTFGDSGRNILRGPSWKTINLSLAKNFPIRKLGEGGQFQMRVDAYNAFNHPNFGMPNAAIGTPAAGVISSANPGRNLQIGAKVSF